ncbi:MAG: group III truncated hemoglobin [Weeksellaceae bacterium]|jgi:hemoglobin|nr:group III truncated hemoglobin [Weeksellaceae bacterium]
MENTIEIKELNHIKLLVDSFYGKIRKDDLLKDIFEDVIQDRWPEHLEKMYRFWQTVLLDERTYNGKPFVPHMKLPVDKQHFERWLELFDQTLEEHFHGPAVYAAKAQANRMAQIFYSKINYFKQLQ